MNKIFRPVVLEKPASVGIFNQNFIAELICDVLNHAHTPPVPDVPPGCCVWIAAAQDPYKMGKSGNRSRAVVPRWVDQKTLFESLSETGTLIEPSHARTEVLAALARRAKSGDLVVSLFDFDGAPFDCYWKNLHKFASHWRYAILSAIKGEVV